MCSTTLDNASDKNNCVCDDGFWLNIDQCTQCTNSKCKTCIDGTLTCS